MAAKCPIRPSRDRIVVQRDKPPEATRGGIIQSKVPRAVSGVVLAVGPGGERHGNDLDSGVEIVEMRSRVGDRVVFPDFGGCEVEVGDTKYLVLREGELVGYLEPDAPHAEKVAKDD